jgi:hypothetical protein
MKNAQEEGEEIDAKGSYATIFDGIECVCMCVSLLHLCLELLCIKEKISLT